MTVPVHIKASLMPTPAQQAIEWLFIATTAVTGYFFLKANPKLKIVAPLLVLWLVVQAVLVQQRFYSDTSSVPPRLIMAIGPPVLAIIACFVTAGGRRYVDGLDARQLTWLHTVRVPVEVVLYFLMTYKAIPMLMTFEGRNFDIVSGITAPLIAWFGYHRNRLSRPLIIAWNLLCLGLLINVVYYGILSAPTKFQQYAFDQPNVAILHFPFIWLPAFIVPLVCFSHLVAIRQLLKKRA